ncbi:hypothetical protein LNAOJCKE_5579 [Methylorubrum aminovorans]|uniref:Uncharacterized protein n=1 Tax=Methylorubrum aminovorans TaxID=269069 RepID=A0ABQ4ULY6_9HYPH|nr:hypothetical protein LNAOJCKE_5579 [Methylorubrum aminovorans]
MLERKCGKLEAESAEAAVRQREGNNLQPEQRTLDAILRVADERDSLPHLQLLRFALQS